MGRPLNPDKPNETPRQRHEREKQLTAAGAPSDGGDRAPSDGSQAKFEAVPPARKAPAKKKSSKR